MALSSNRKAYNSLVAKRRTTPNKFIELKELSNKTCKVIIIQKYTYIKSNLYTLIRVYKNDFKSTSKKAQHLSLGNHKDLTKFDYIIEEYFQNNKYSFILLPFRGALETQIMNMYIYLKTLETKYKFLKSKVYKSYDLSGGGPQRNPLKTHQPKSTDAERKAKLKEQRDARRAVTNLKRSAFKDFKDFNKQINSYSDLLTDFRRNPTLPPNIAAYLNASALLKDDIDDDEGDDGDGDDDANTATATNNATNIPNRNKFISNSSQCQGAGLHQGCSDKCYLCMIATPPYKKNNISCPTWPTPIDKILTRECEHKLYFKLAYQLNALVGLTDPVTSLQKNNYDWSHKLCNGTHKSQACFIDYDIVNNKWIINDEIIKAVIVSILSDNDWQNIIWSNSNSEWLTKGWPADLNILNIENVEKLFETIHTNIANSIQVMVNILNYTENTLESTPQPIIFPTPIPEYTSWFVTHDNGNTLHKITIVDLYNTINKEIPQNTIIYKNNTPCIPIENYKDEITLQYKNYLAIQEEKKLKRVARNSKINEAYGLAVTTQAKLNANFKDTVFVINPNIHDLKNYEGVNIIEKFHGYYNLVYNSTLLQISRKITESNVIRTAPRLITDSSPQLDRVYKEIDSLYDTEKKKLKDARDGIIIRFNKLYINVIKEYIKTNSYIYILDDMNQWYNININSLNQSHIGYKISTYNNGFYSINLTKDLLKILAPQSLHKNDATPVSSPKQTPTPTSTHAPTPEPVNTHVPTPASTHDQHPQSAGYAKKKSTSRKK